MFDRTHRRNRAKSLRKQAVGQAVACVTEPLERRVFLSASTVVTNLSNSGAGSLRQAILNAQLNGGAQTVTFQSRLAGTITLTGGDLELSDANTQLTIRGPGANAISVSGDGASTVFLVDQDANAAISGLKITDGKGTQGQGNGDGGGIYSDGTLSVSNCTFSDDKGTFGGGIDTYNDGNLTIADCTFSDDTASWGAGLDSGGGTVNITNSTFANNSADWGGGIYTGGTLNATNCTISDNIGSAGPASSGAGIDDASGNVTLNNTIVAGNVLSSDPASDVSGTLNTASSYNLIGSGGSGGLTNGVDGNIVGITSDGLFLGSLANNGGSTQTIEPLTGSPAIHAGSVTLAEDAGLTTDQRGDPRIVDNLVDIGAYQSQSAYPVVMTDPTSQSVDVGNPVTFTAAASGNPTPTVQWEVSSDNGRKYSDIAGATNTSYDFTPAANQNGDDYRAVFTNSQSSATTSAATLTVISSSISGDVYNVHGGAGMAGVTLTLQSLKHGRAKGAASTTTTDSNGDYSFTGLAAGTYSVSETLPSRYNLITPTSGSYTIALSAGQSSTGNDFGDKKKRGRSDVAFAMRESSPFAITSSLGSFTASQADGSALLLGSQNQSGLFAD